MSTTVSLFPLLLPSRSPFLAQEIPCIRSYCNPCIIALLVMDARNNPDVSLKNEINCDTYAKWNTMYLI